MTINELKTLNDLSSNTIRIGQRLTVRSNTAPPSVARTAKSSPQGKFLIYEVSDGTISLQNLLKKFKMTKQEFQALNPTVKETNFHSGRKLTVLAPPNRKYENPYLSEANLQNLGETAVTKYGNSEAAKPTTSGELYSPNALTAAHPNISLGSVIFIKNPENQKGIYVRINDRNSGNGLKLSLTAWQTLDFKSSSPKVTIYQNE
jgi:rare lipoprotein A (peptidoglycan hydrolase)